MSDLRDLQKEIYKFSNEKGWWQGATDNPSIIPEKLALVHCEVSEAMEEYRDGNMDMYFGLNNKPEGFGVELADVVIRVLDLAEHLDIDLNALIIRKMAFNQTREFRHGGKKA